MISLCCGSDFHRFGYSIHGSFLITLFFSTEKPPQKKTKTASTDYFEEKANETTEFSTETETEEKPLSNLSDYEKCSIFPQKLHQLLKNNEVRVARFARVANRITHSLTVPHHVTIEPEKFTRIMNKVSRTGKKKVKLDSILRNLYRWYVLACAERH